jgi:hypothetical protein
MKTLLTFLFVAIAASWAHGQSRRAIRQQESAQLTQEQRLVRAADKKGKGGKKDLSMKKRVKMDQREDKRARKIKNTQRRPSGRRPR